MISINKEKNTFYNVNEFSFIVMKGIPAVIRKTVWTLFVGNQFYLTNNIIDIYASQIEKVNFNLCIELYDKDKSKPITGEYPTNKIIKDIIKATKFYAAEIEESKLNKIELMENIFQLVRSFCFLRPDTFYSSCLVNICLILFLQGFEKYENFILMCNLVLKSPLMNFLTRDNAYIHFCSEFFDNLLKKYVPDVYTHFSKLGISPSLFFATWYETLFFAKFNYANTVKVLNSFIFKGERIIFQTGLVLFSLQKDDF